jgi:transcriptional accessory protein Tex/SPT6
MRYQFRRAISINVQQQQSRRHETSRFIRDPPEVVAVDDIVKVTVLEIDAARRRIALSRKSQT